MPLSVRGNICHSETLQRSGRTHTAYADQRDWWPTSENVTAYLWACDGAIAPMACQKRLRSIRARVDGPPSRDRKDPPRPPLRRIAHQILALVATFP